MKIFDHKIKISSKLIIILNSSNINNKWENFYYYTFYINLSIYFFSNIPASFYILFISFILMSNKYNIVIHVLKVAGN